MARRALPERADGQALVELVLVLPIFLALLFGIIDLGRVIWANDSVANAAREGSRWASVHAGTPGVSPYNKRVSKDEIKAYTKGFVIAGGVDTTVAVCFSSVGIAGQEVGCSGDVDEVGAAFARGNLVTVTVVSHVPIFTGALVGFGDFTVTGTSTVLINN